MPAQLPHEGVVPLAVGKQLAIVRLPPSAAWSFPF